MTDFQDQLKTKMHQYVKKTYEVTRQFPKEELYGVTSQLRRAALSVVLNYIEGYARFKPKIKLQFYETSYGSLKESKYLIFFSHGENYIPSDEYKTLSDMGEEIGKMLWSEIKSLN